MSKRGSGEGSIYQMSDGRWRAAISLGHKNGKRLRKIITAQTRREVQEQLTANLRAQQQGLSIAPERQTVAQFLAYWLDEVIPSRGAKPKTETFYRYVVNHHISPAIGTIPIQKLSPQHVQGLINDKLTTQCARRQTNLSATTVRHIHRVLNIALEVAVKYGTVQRNVAHLVDPPATAEKKIRFLTVEQARDVLAAAVDHPLYALYATILSLGLRLGEGLGLTWNNVDLPKSRITVEHTLQRVKGEMVLLKPKTKGSARKVSMPGITMAALSEHRARQQGAQDWAAEGWIGNPWNLVFTSSNGTPLDERNVLRTFQKTILTKAGLPKMRIHDLRHSAVAILLAQGVQPLAISELLGHSSVAFTLKVYGHLMEETKRETADRMNDALVIPVATNLATKAIPNRVN